MKDQQKVLQALVEEPSRYYITVLDGTMLPAGMQKKKEVEFEIKPPTMEVLAQCAIPLQSLPDKPEKMTFKEAVSYIDQMVRIVCIVCHRSTKYPSWCEPFIKNNTTPKELHFIFHETYAKMKTDFFLNSFQTASLINPMMMKTKREMMISDSILTNS